MSDKTSQKLEANGLPIRAVTVYSDGARVEIQLGASGMLFRNLASLSPSFPPCILTSKPNSPQAGTDKFITDKFPAAKHRDSLQVDTAPPPPGASCYAESPELDALSDEQKDEHAGLLRRKDLLTMRVTALDKSIAIYKSYADSLHSRILSAPTRGTVVDAGSEDVDEISQLEEFITSYPDKLEELFEKQQKAQGELDGVQLDIADLVDEGKRILEKTDGDGVSLTESGEVLKCSFLTVRRF